LKDINEEGIEDKLSLGSSVFSKSDDDVNLPPNSRLAKSESKNAMMDQLLLDIETELESPPVTKKVANKKDEMRLSVSI
jgi:hypothetical protein